MEPRFTSKSVRIVVVSLSALALVVSIAGAVWATQQSEEEQALIKYRQTLMTGLRASMASIGDILKFRMPYSTKHIEVHARNIHTYASLIPDAFEQKLAEGLTDAQPVVWDSWDDFVAKAKALEEASAKLAEAAKGGEVREVMPHVQGVGDACRGCHNTYRKPEEERFERK
jgi:cytochrome c556